ncbi:uncharacterized protein yip3 isoform X2 [Drosophila bipectinata]|uniref:uncharacterized protein yip3 isoform X2 n=1 Tax=Drosophila bipectinata TaxID=42026 RepID=UPI0038B26E2F
MTAEEELIYLNFSTRTPLGSSNLIMASADSREDGTMVGVLCDEGILLATNSRDNLLCHLDERVYCCAPRADRDIIQDVGTQVDYQTNDRHQKLTVAQVKDMLCRKYEQAATVDILVAGEDRNGLHMYELQPKGKASIVQQAAKGGTKAEEVLFCLDVYRKDPMNLAEAEQLVRESLQVGPNDYVEMCFIYKEEPNEVEEGTPPEIPPETESQADAEIQSVSGRSPESMA